MDVRRSELQLRLRLRLEMRSVDELMITTNLHIKLYLYHCLTITVPYITRKYHR